MTVIAWAIIVLAVLFYALITVVMIRDYRHWKRDQAAHEQRIRENWARFSAAIEQQCNDRSDTTAKT